MVKKIILCIAGCFLLTACCSTGKRTDQSILDYQRQIDRLEEELRARDRAIEDSYRRLESITARSEAMGGDIDDIIELLDEYQRTVERCLQDYRAAGLRKQETEEDAG